MPDTEGEQERINSPSMVGLVFEVRDPSVRVARVGRELGVAHRGEPFEPIGPDPEFRLVVRLSGIIAGAGIGLTLAVHLWAMGTGIRGCKRGRSGLERSRVDCEVAERCWETDG